MENGIKSDIHVAAVVLNYNSSSDCRKCVSYLSKQTYPNLSIILVDNASTKKGEVKELNRLRQEYNVKVVFSKKNRGFSAGNNLGLQVAVQDGAEWMLVINPDVELRELDYISHVVSQLKKWPEAVVIGTNVLLPNGQKQNPIRELRFWEEFFWPMDWIKQKLKIWNGYRTEDVTGYCEKLSGCCFFISKKFLEQINYLDEHVFMYSEESILAKQVERAGCRELYIREATAYHQHISSQKGDAKKRMQMLFKSREYYLNNYSGYPKPNLKLLLVSRKIQSLFWK